MFSGSYTATHITSDVMHPDDYTDPVRCGSESVRTESEPMEFSAGIHILPAVDPQPMPEDWTGSGVRVFEVNTGRATDRTAIMHAFAQTVPLEPPTAGRSWDAFSDSFWQGLYELDEERVVILLRGEHWVNQPQGEVQTALDVLQDVATLLKEEKATVGRPTTLCVLLHD